MHLPSGRASWHVDFVGARRDVFTESAKESRQLVVDSKVQVGMREARGECVQGGVEYLLTRDECSGGGRRYSKIM